MDFEHPQISVKRQCQLLGINRSTLYYRPRGDRADDMGLMQRIDKIYTEMPFYGSRKIAEQLTRDLGYDVNRKRVQRLMAQMGIQAVYAKYSMSDIKPFGLPGRVAALWVGDKCFSYDELTSAFPCGRIFRFW